MTTTKKSRSGRDLDCAIQLDNRILYISLEGPEIVEDMPDLLNPLIWGCVGFDEKPHGSILFYWPFKIGA